MMVSIENTSQTRHLQMIKERMNERNNKGEDTKVVRERSGRVGIARVTTTNSIIKNEIMRTQILRIGQFRGLV